MDLSIKQIIAAIRARPELAVELVKGCRVAGPWVPNMHYMGDLHGTPTGDYSSRKSIWDESRFSASVTLIKAGRYAGRWDWWAEGKREPREFGSDSAATETEARAMADALLASFDAILVAR